MTPTLLAQISDPHIQVGRGDRDRRRDWRPRSPR